ncbi:MAG: DegV family protein [Peptococcaceae bacterium]|nr:DegV family protein [Peptococcaceae bacterium]
MSSVHIVTDSTADIPSWLARKLNITVMPLKVIFGNEAYRDGLDISLEEFYSRLKSEPASTSQPSPGEFIETYKPIIEQGQSIVSIHISSLLSGTVQSAQLAKATLGNADIEIIDSRLTSMALGIVVLAAAQTAQNGQNKEQVLALVRFMLEHIGVYFLVDTLDYLQRGGRIGKAQAFLGSLLNIKPILELRDGIVSPVEKARGRKRGLERLVELTRKSLPATEIPPGFIIVHGNIPEVAADLDTMVAECFGHGSYLIGSVGAVIGTHTGPGVVALIYYPDCLSAQIFN